MGKLEKHAPEMLDELKCAEKLLTGIFQYCDLPDDYQNETDCAIERLRAILKEIKGVSHD